MTVILLLCVAAFLALSVLAILGRRWRGIMALTYGASLAVSLVALVVAGRGLLGGGLVTPDIVLPLGLPWQGAHFHLDALAAFFLVTLNLGGAAASLYALGYGRHAQAQAQSRILPFYPAFLGSMNLVVLSADAYSFLLAWELMSLVSWALVISSHRDAENNAAGYLYLVMASLGTLALLLAFGLLAGPGGSYVFAAIATNPPRPAIAALVLVLVLVGAGSKAGLVPLHVWLPRAHPAAPSHVSALMSGVMTKIAIYAVIRLLFDMLGPPAWWWGMVVVLIGGLTAALGVLHALLERDLKRLLAYSTIENIGLIFVSLGLALAFRANGLPDAAALATTAALFHVFNHMLFKSTLFFGAGAVQTATGTRDLELLGGLIHRMPRLALPMLVACLAISALPPLNGFASEWLTFQAILLSPELPQWGLKLAVPAMGTLLALSAALAAACFVRLFGLVFLGRPRSEPAARAGEADRWSLSAMAILAALCVLAGLLPGVVIDALAPAVRNLVGGGMPVQSGLPWLTIIPIAASRSSYNGILTFLFIAASASLTAFLVHRFASRKVRRAPPWDCGYGGALGQAAQYSATSFSQPLRRVFATLAFRSREEVTMPPPGDLAPARLVASRIDPVWEIFYLPVGRAVGFAATQLNRLQFQSIRRYLSFVFLTLVLLLLVLAIWH